MRRYIPLLFVLLICFPGVSSTSDEINNDLLVFAEGMLELLVDEKFDSLATYFDEQMSTALPVQQLAQTWQAVLTQAGKFQSKVDEQTLTQQGYDIVIFRCEFENAPVNVQFVFNAGREISGLFLRPAGQ